MISIYFSGLFLSAVVSFFMAGIYDSEYEDLIGFLFLSLVWPMVALLAAIFAVGFPLYFLGKKMRKK